MSALDTPFVIFGYLEITYLPDESGPAIAGYVLESDFLELRKQIEHHNRRRCISGQRILGKSFGLQQYRIGPGGCLEPNGRPFSIEPFKMADVRLIDRKQAVDGSKA